MDKTNVSDFTIFASAREQNTKLKEQFVDVSDKVNVQSKKITDAVFYGQAAEESREDIKTVFEAMSIYGIGLMDRLNTTLTRIENNYTHSDEEVSKKTS